MNATHPFYRLLATRYDAERENEAIHILDNNPETARLEWQGTESGHHPFIVGSTALHYAANDGKLTLVRRLVERGADVNASNARWYRSVLSWAANNARVETIKSLLDFGARADSPDAMHAAAWGGSGRGEGLGREYAESLKLLIEAGADLNDRRNQDRRTPLAMALKSGNMAAIEFLRSHGAAES